MRGTWLGWIAVVLLSCSDDSSTSSSGASSSGASSSGTSGAADSGGSTPTSSTVYDLCFDKLNAYRASLTPPLPAYQRWSDGQACADTEAKSDSQTNKAHGAFPSCGELAQNECPNAFGPPEDGIPACLQLMWKEGPGGGHYDNMTSTKYTKATCGVFVTPSGSVWSVQNFR